MSDSSSDSDSASANVKVWIDRDDTKIPVISGYRTARTDGPKSMVGLLGSKPKIRNLQRNSSVMFGDQSYSFDQQFRRLGTWDHPWACLRWGSGGPDPPKVLKSTI